MVDLRYKEEQGIPITACSDNLAFATMRVMEILRSILLYTRSNAMDCVVIGGHAINAYGLDRHTGDLDLVAPLSQREKWLGFMTDLRYVIGQNSEYFARFRPDSIAAWPIDLMFVDDDTFNKIKASASEFEFGTVKAPVASVVHLIALKLHALKQSQEHRSAKDFSDLLFLVGRSGLGEQELEALCATHGNRALWERLKLVLKHD
ncbi:MAG: nucleotidyl transferase AbiEii/AbiGii toxin family protein [Bdellovibrionota bacterium]|nr:MAG: nucleotidyl transferase AbiEii/AbiGii toxin family protein [Bdellovibrionota bacterium]